jgi:hypothetical protein
MFPITPVEINEGWVEGKERTITCVSRDFRWRHKSKPTVRLFDITGREKKHGFALVPDGNGWLVQVRLKDWAEIAVIEG